MIALGVVESILVLQSTKNNYSLDASLLLEQVAFLNEKVLTKKKIVMLYFLIGKLDFYLFYASFMRHSSLEHNRMHMLVSFFGATAASPCRVPRRSYCTFKMTK